MSAFGPKRTFAILCAGSSTNRYDSSVLNLGRQCDDAISLKVLLGFFLAARRARWAGASYWSAHQRRPRFWSERPSGSLSV